MLFAGEPTSSLPNSVEAEIESGKREADRLQSYLNNPEEYRLDPRNRPKPATTTGLKETVDVLVLGAGTAGVAAARSLKINSTLSFLVLEGNSRHGGRIQNVPLINLDPELNDTVMVSGGAQWLHARSNPLYDYAIEHNLIILPDSDEGAGTYYRNDGYIYDQELTDEIYEIVDSILTDAQRFFTEDIYPYPPNMEVYVREEFEKYIEDYAEEDKEKARQILGWHELFKVIDWAAPEFNAISAKSWGRFQLVDDSWEHINLKEGIWGLLRDMIQEVGPEHFLYNKVVRKINWGHGFDLGDDKKSRRVLVKTEDGSIYAADFIIPTFSLGVLKHDADRMFAPSISQRHRQFVKCAGYFSITKVGLKPLKAIKKY